MTEQQIRQFKNLLDSSDADTNSSALDDKILAAAKASVSTAQENQFNKATSERLNNNLVWAFLSSNAMTAVAVSLLLTFSVFIIMSQALKTDNQVTLANNKSTQIDVDFDLPQTKQSPKAKAAGVMKRPDAVAQAPTNSLDARNQILAQMTLPNVQEVIGVMEFSLDADRVLAQQSVQLAMNDIRSMIGQGRLNNARQRYELLRDSCSVCTLPNTLESLVLNAVPTADSS